MPGRQPSRPKAEKLLGPLDRQTVLLLESKPPFQTISAMLLDKTVNQKTGPLSARVETTEPHRLASVLVLRDPKNQSLLALRRHSDRHIIKRENIMHSSIRPQACLTNIQEWPMRRPCSCCLRLPSFASNKITRASGTA